MRRDILGLVLAGGRSARMGESKEEMRIHEGVSQLDYLLEALETFCSRTAVSVRQDQQLSQGANKYAVIEDGNTSKGPINGIISGLRKSEGLPVLAVACDMPFVDAALFLQLVSLRDHDRMATCFVAEDGMPEPLCAIYEARSLSLLEARALKGEWSLRRFLIDEDVETIKPARPNLLAGVNTMSEAKEARKRLSDSSQ